MTFIWERKNCFKKDFPLNNQCPLVSCFLHTSHLLWPYIASYPCLVRVILTRNVQSKTFEQQSNCKGLEKAQQSFCFCHGLFQLQVSTVLLYLSFFMFNLELQQNRNVGWRVDLRIPFPNPAHYLQQSKGFIVLFLSLLFNIAHGISNFKGKESSWRNRDFILGLPRSIERFVLKNRLLLSLNYHM